VNTNQHPVAILREVARGTRLGDAGRNGCPGKVGRALRRPAFPWLHGLSICGTNPFPVPLCQPSAGRAALHVRRNQFWGPPPQKKLTRAALRTSGHAKAIASSHNAE